MGSQGESQDKGTDSTVGELVWVWRRNGSWWPGQIIDTDECAQSLVASPRAGTPIKLLRREDVGVDWYNLEKSKRVKPFRCGEYDNCIEKAKLAYANSARKAVKYPRRDDAILHALEIEMEQQNYDPVKSSPAAPEHKDGEFSGYESSDNSVHDLIEDPNQLVSSSVEQSLQARPRRTPNDSEDDGTEGVKRMRGLDDLGIGPIPAMKRKRTLVGHVHEFLKKKNRSRPLTKVLESSAIIDGPVVCCKFSPNGFGSNESNQSSSVVINNSDNIGVRCENRNLGNAFGHVSELVPVSCKPREKEISHISGRLEKASSEKLFDVSSVPNRTQSTTTAPNFLSQKLRGGAGKQSSQSNQAETLSLGNEESVSTSSGAADVDSINLGMENGNSRWQSKRKRNLRNIRIKKPNIRKVSNVDGDFNDNNLDEYWGHCGRSSSKIPLPRSLPHRQSRCVMNPKYGPEFSLINEDDSDSELYDVIIEVKSSSRQQAPFISLMSKLSGHPVIGHPTTVEVLEDGSTNDLVRDAKWDLNDSIFEMKVPSKHLRSHRVPPIKSKKPRKSSPTSKKIRKLSSLTGFSKLNGERSLVVEKITGHAVACVPLKIVYSRINACLKLVMRPPRQVVKRRRQ